MHISKKTLAVGLCAALGSTLCVAPAHAEVTIDGPTAIVDGFAAKKSRTRGRSR